MADTFTKLELTTALRERTGLPANECASAIDALLDILIGVFRLHQRVELRGFGVFEPRERKAHKGRNPRTGESVEVRAQWTVTFKPGKELKAKVNEGLK